MTRVRPHRLSRGEAARFRVYAVRWPVLDGVHGEGLLLEPRDEPVAHAIVLPDADQTPEQLAGLSPGLATDSELTARQAGRDRESLLQSLGAAG